MFGRLGKKPDETPSLPVGPLDRIGRRMPADAKPEVAAPPPDRDARLATATATLRGVVEPKLREMLKSRAPAGEITRQAGMLTQLHFRSTGVPLAPLELRVHVAEVLRPVLPATAFSRPASTPQPAAASLDAAADVVPAPAAATPAVERPAQP